MKKSTDSFSVPFFSFAAIGPKMSFGVGLPKFLDYMQIVRPFIYSTDNDEYPFWGRGSCFLISSNGRYFVVTAGHIVDKHQLENINIPAAEPSLQRLPLKRHFVPRSKETQDTDFLDVEILEVDVSKAIESEVEILNFVHFPEFALDPRNVSIGQKLVVIGIPSGDLSFDYEKRLVQYKRFACDATYGGQSFIHACHTAHIVQQQPDRLTSLDGFSGGPVLAWIDTKTGGTRLGLVGIALRGTTTASSITFIGVDCLLELLYQIYK